MPSATHRLTEFKPVPRGVWLGLVAFGCLTSPASAQTVRGLVLDAVTEQPVPLVTVSLMSSSGERIASTLATDEGFYSLTAKDDGTYLIRAVALGYSVGRAGPFDLDEDDLQVIEVRLSPQPLEVEGIVVQGEGGGNSLARNGFWDRMEEGRGQFITPGEVARSEAMFTPHLLRGLDHVRPQYGAAPWATWVQLQTAVGSGSGPCTPFVYVDNVWVNRPDFGIAETAGLDEVIPMEHILAVEVYWGPFQAPMRYQGPVSLNDCGVILFWTTYG